MENNTNLRTKLFDGLREYLSIVESHFDDLNVSRINSLSRITEYISNKLSQGDKAKLNFICTQNSRRSHIAQLFAKAASYYYGIHNIECYSGGTLASAFNHRAVAALERCGFRISKASDGTNPVYMVSFGDEIEKVKSFSKLYDDIFNPKEDFAAIMVCSSADEACPFVPGADKRFSLPFSDPKDYDGTSEEAIKYDETCQLIATQIMLIFSKIN